MQSKLHTKISINKEILRRLEVETRHLNLIRSTELGVVAYEKGLLNKLIVNLPKAKKTLLESILWGMKLNGCSISESEIDTILKYKFANSLTTFAHSANL